MARLMGTRKQTNTRIKPTLQLCLNYGNLRSRTSVNVKMPLYENNKENPIHKLRKKKDLSYNRNKNYKLVFFLKL